MNWILHFGLPPRFSPGVRIIQLDILPEELGHNVEADARLVGDCKASVQALLEGLKGFKCKQKTWIDKLKQKSEANLQLNDKLIAADDFPMTYYNSMGTIKKYLP